MRHLRNVGSALSSDMYRLRLNQIMNGVGDFSSALSSDMYRLRRFLPSKNYKLKIPPFPYTALYTMPNKTTD